MSAHAVLAPSAAHRWKFCTGATAATIDAGDNSSEYAREGTAAHILAERTLSYAEEGRRAEFWIGETIPVAYEEDGQTKTQIFTVDDEMAEYVQVYVDQVLREPGHLLVEEKFDLIEVYGVPEQFGTGDAVKLDYENERIYVGDLKYGRGVPVFAKDNDQMYSYAGGALRAYTMLGNWETITVAVHQPRIGHYDEHTLTRKELEAWIVDTAIKAQAAMMLIGEPMEVIEAAMVPGEKQCQWCPRKAVCGPLANWTHEQIYEDFVSLNAEPEKPRDATQLSDEMIGKLLRRVDLIESVTREWRSEGKRRLEAGMTVPGWKLVEGRRGNRQWKDEKEAEKVMKAARIKKDEMYSFKLLSFPQAEKKFAKAKPKLWPRLSALMTQNPGKPAIAPEEDPAPAVTVATEDQFKDQSDISDLV
jgi:hypothetical protein